MPLYQKAQKPYCKKFFCRFCFKKVRFKNTHKIVTQILKKFISLSLQNNTLRKNEQVLLKKDSD